MQENHNEDNQIEKVEVDKSHIFSGLGKGQKIALAVLAFFAVIVFIFGIINIQKGIYSPFERKTSAKNNVVNPENLCLNGNCSDLSDADLKNKDTDKDGLSDYDELNFYKTSPYLEDSDSDGFLDKEEIDNNKNPNCPAGKDCDNDVLFNEDAQLVNQGTANSANLEELNGQIGPSNMQIGDLAGKDMDVADLRKLLIEAGMEKATLDQISDKDLMESFSEALAEK
ncbi:hypothetical protein KAU09_05515 [Candidatus Parcubacteria bacterium]|nr:hypothetical protein [Candidatus Parcubacteria bacterium]